MRLIMLGPPGSGKGTQAALIAERIAVVHLSVGALLRREVQARSALGARIADAVGRGDLVVFSDVLAVLTEPLAHATSVGGWVLDGAPRTGEQAVVLDVMLQRLSAAPDVAIALEVPDDELRSRLLRRASLDHRVDDSADVIDHRLATWRVQAPAVLSWFETSGTLRRVDGTGDSGQVAARVAGAIRSLLPAV